MSPPAPQRIEPAGLAPADAGAGAGPTRATLPAGAAAVPPPSAPGAASRRAALQRRWQALDARERRLSAIAAVLVVLLLVWLVAVRPAWRTLAVAAGERAQLEVQWQTMQALAVESSELRAAPRVGRTQAVAALEAATARAGAAAKLSVQGDRAVLTLDGIGTAALRDWLAEARSGARARPIEANLSRGATGYSGTLVVAVGGRT